MSITDELRKYVNEELDQDYDILEWLIELANRIDERHAKSLDQCDVHWQDVIDKQQALVSHSKQDYIELPKDKNGKVIHTDDKVSMNGETRCVCGVSETRVFVFDSVNGNTAPWIAKFCELIEPDTQEKIDADTKLIWRDYLEKHKITADFAIGADVQVRRDLLHRQRELDGVK